MGKLAVRKMAFRTQLVNRLTKDILAVFLNWQKTAVITLFSE